MCRRFAQQMIILVHILSMAIGSTLFVLLLFIPNLTPLLLTYAIAIQFSDAGVSGRLSQRSQFFRSCRVWKAFASYFPVRLHRTVELPASRNYIFGYHPHGIICHGAFICFGTEALGFSRLFPGITNSFLTLDSNFRVPLYREYILFLGMGGVSRSSCQNLLSRGGHDGRGMGRAITIAIGGARESLLATPGTMRLILRDRKGFVTLAIQQGADLVPVLGFGENCLYSQSDIAYRNPLVLNLQLFIKKIFGWTTPLFRGDGLLGKGPGLLPYQNPLDVVVGRPIRVGQCDSPDEEYVDTIHQKYMEEIERIWVEWKDVVPGDPAMKLEFV